MTVHELIEKLSTFPREIPVLVEDGMDPSDLTDPRPTLQDGTLKRLGAPDVGEYVTL